MNYKIQNTTQDTVKSF